MNDFDVFNGDADGLISLHQLRMTEPREAQLFTGTKREINLLERVEAGAGDRVTVLDVSLDQNRTALIALLMRGAEIDYFDHHYAGNVPNHRNLRAHIDARPDVCTSLIVDRHLSGRFRRWAVVAAFGDNLCATAQELAAALDLPATAVAQLRELGECLNYNSYGESLTDLHYHPAELYRALHAYSDPLTFIAERPEFKVLREAMAEDLQRALNLRPEHEWPGGLVYRLPNEPWCRRISGIFANCLNQAHPTQATALVSQSTHGCRVSVRLPPGIDLSADELCREFPSGGGRALAAGINCLNDQELKRFLVRFRQATSRC